MKLVEGGTLAERISGYRPREVAVLLAKLARAVHHAHERGVLHRDLKPGNMLLDANGEPHITDFGLARQLGADSSLTMTGSTLGTPAYMSPEQARGEKTITTATDVWSLGAILFHLLTGRPPFNGATATDVLLQVRMQEPPRPRSLFAGIPADLETICLKCLEKDPTRRFSSARRLAEDLERWQRHEPIEARPVSSAERLFKWARRHPARAGLALVSGIAIFVVLGVVLFFDARVQQKSAQLAETLLRQDWPRAEKLFAEHKAAEGLALLARMLRDQPENPAIAERILWALAWHDFALPDGPVLRTEADFGFSFAAFSRDGQRLITGDAGGLRHWDARTGEPLTPSPSNETRAPDVILKYDLSADGRLALSRRVDPGAPTLLRLWNVSEPRVLGDWRLDQPVTNVNFSTDGQSLSVSTTNEVRRLDRWRDTPGTTADSPYAAHNPTDPRWRAEIHTLTLSLTNTVTDQVLAEAIRHEREPNTVNISPDGQRLVTASVDRTARTWRIYSARYAPLELRHGGGVSGAKFSPDGMSVMTLGGTNGVKLWDARSGQLKFHLQHGGMTFDGNFDPTGRRIITGGNDSCARVWDARTGQEILPPMRHEPVATADRMAEIFDTRFSPDGRRILTSGFDGTTRLWHAETHRAVGSPLVHESPVHFATVSRDGSRVLSSAFRSAHLWDAHSFQPVARLADGAWSVGTEFSPDGRRVLIGARMTATVFDAFNGQPAGISLPHPAVMLSTGFSPDGRWIVTSDQTGSVRLWDARTGLAAAPPMLHAGWVNITRVSRDSQRVLSCSDDGLACLWDAHTGLPVSDPLKHPQGLLSASFSTNRGWMLTAGADGVARLWELPVVAAPAPRWLPELAEAIAGLRFNAQRVIGLVTFEELQRIRQQVQSSRDTDPCTRWAQWFFDERPVRGVSPASAITIAEHVDLCLAENTRERLREACRLSPTNALVNARLRELESK